MSKFKDGDEDSFLQLYHEFKKPIFFYLLTLLKNQADAEEVTHDTFLKIYSQKKQYKPEFSFTTWAWSIARNTAIDRMRRKDPLNLATSLEEPSLSKSLYDDSRDFIKIEDLFESIHQRRSLLFAVESLPTSQREVVSLRLYGEMELSEIAEITQKNLSSVKSLFYRAQKDLTDKLRNDHNDHKESLQTDHKEVV